MEPRCGGWHIAFDCRGKFFSPFGSSGCRKTARGWLDTIIAALSAEAPVSFKDTGEIPLAEALRHHLDITRPTRGFLEAIAERTPEAAFAPLLDPERKADLDRWLWAARSPTCWPSRGPACRRSC